MKRACCDAVMVPPCGVPWDIGPYSLIQGYSSVATAGISRMTIQKVKRLFLIHNCRSAQPRCDCPLRVEPIPLHCGRWETGIEMTTSGSSSPGTVSTYSHANESHQIANGQYDLQKGDRRTPSEIS
jgi:hypothetical protein